MEIGNRLNEFIHSVGLDSSEFAESIGVSSTTIHHIVSEKGRKNAPSKDTIDKILKKYPRLSVKWLISGEGNMLTDNKPLKKFDNPFNADLDDVEELKRLVRELQEKNRKLGEQNFLLVNKLLGSDNKS